MYKDEIISEVWRNRDAYTQAHHHNLDEIVADLRRRQQAHAQIVVDRSKDRPASTVRGTPRSRRGA